MTSKEGGRAGRMTPGAGPSGITFGRGLMAGAAALSVVIGLAARRPEDPQPPPAATPDAFHEVDLDFRSFYADGRAATSRRLGPIIIANADRLTLLRDGRRTEVEVIPPLYHRLKALSHIPLAFYVALAPHGEGPIDAGRLERLRSFRGRIAAVEKEVEGAGFDAAQEARARSLLGRCSAFLDEVLATGRHDRAGLQALTRAAAPIVLANAADAAKAQIDAYHARVSAWRREMPADEWARVRVLVMGFQMPRKRNTAVQYFAKLLGLAGESQRLVYAEELSGEAQGLNLLATHQLDGELAAAFFDDPGRMEIDLLGNAASVYLDTLDLDP